MKSVQLAYLIIPIICSIAIK